MKIKTTIKYISDDGKSFDREEYCLEHEERVKNGGIYMYGRKISKDELLSCIGFSGNYFLCNYSPGKLTIMAKEGGGAYGEIYGEIADELGMIYDSWNYNVYENRKLKGGTQKVEKEVK